MSKNKQIIIIILIAAILVGSGAFLYIRSLHKVDFRMSDNISVTIYRIDKGDYIKIAQIDGNKTMSLSNGTYCAKSNNADFSSTPDCVVVNGEDMVLKYKPDYSESKLDKLLETERLATQDVINSRYAPIIASYNTSAGRLFKRGEWYATILTEITSSGEIGEEYRVVLKKENGNWVVTAYPQIFLSSAEYPNIPFEILSDVNKMVGDY